MVPVSCPPCPASTTIRPIFRPSALVKDCVPDEGGVATCAEETAARSSWTGGIIFLAGGPCGVMVFTVGPDVGLAVARSAASMVTSSAALAAAVFPATEAPVEAAISVFAVSVFAGSIFTCSALACSVLAGSIFLAEPDSPPADMNTGAGLVSAGFMFSGAFAWATVALGVAESAPAALSDGWGLVCDGGVGAGGFCFAATLLAGCLPRMWMIRRYGL